MGGGTAARHVEAAVGCNPGVNPNKLPGESPVKAGTVPVPGRWPRPRLGAAPRRYAGRKATRVMSVPDDEMSHLFSLGGKKEKKNPTKPRSGMGREGRDGGPCPKREAGRAEPGRGAAGAALPFVPPPRGSGSAWRAPQGSGSPLFPPLPPTAAGGRQRRPPAAPGMRRAAAAPPPAR